MAFAYTQIFASSGAGGARQSNPTVGQYSLELYAFTQANTDTTGTITTTMSRPAFALAIGTTSTTASVGCLVSTTANTLTVVSQGSSGSPTAGYVLVIGRGR